jgi:polysaccharide biosynthesis/export protein
MKQISIPTVVLSLVSIVGFWPAEAQYRSADPSGPNLPMQTIGANDLIAVSVYDAPEFTRTVRVSAEGSIALPMLSTKIRAADFMPAELETAIASALEADGILVAPVVTVTVVEYYSRPISVAGAVKAPVTFQATGSVTLLEAITRAGGLAPDAGPEILVTTRQPDPDGKPVALTRRVLVKSLIDAADPDVNLPLSGGEEIRVPEAGKIFVVGNVKRPGVFSVGDSSETSILKMLAMAEGLAPYAARQAYIIRQDDRTGARRELPIELRKIMERKSPDVTLIADDVLYIPDNTGRRNTMSVLGKIAGFGASTASGIIIWSGR